MINKIFIHCSDSPFGNALLIDKWHRERGWRCIGYHFVILNGQLRSKINNPILDGAVESGRPMDSDNKLSAEEKGAHTYGFNNDSISICLIGIDEFTEKQFDSLWILLNALSAQHNLYVSSDIFGHRDFDSKKSCPNFNVKEWIIERESLDEDEPENLPPQDRITVIEKNMEIFNKKLIEMQKALEHLPKNG